jgi:DNA-binding GntR family transcriptional regulator
VLEALAVRLACQNAGREDRARMEAMVDLLQADRLSLAEYAETVKDTHQMIVEASHNEYLADAMAPLQGLSRRFWLSHVRDEEGEMARGTQLHLAILRDVLARAADAAEKSSQALNDYLVEFAYGTLRSQQ